MKERALNQCMSGLYDEVLGYFCPHHRDIWLHKNDQPCLFSMLGALRSFYLGPIWVLIINKLDRHKNVC